MRLGARVVVSIAGVACLAAGWWRWAPTASRPVREGRGAPVASAEAPGSPPQAQRTLIVGGGPTPESTEVSLEQDVALALRTLPGPGRVLFAGGSSAKTVRQLDPELESSALLTRLGDLFQPRAGRHSRYRRPRFTAAPASRDAVTAALSQLLSAGGRPLFVFVAAHGDRGSEPRENSIPLWGGHPLTVADLARLHDTHRRPMRLIVAACFSGGFAELAFARADAKQGVTPAPRCGLFAGAWDRETTGCDPNPDRRAQEGYSLHLLHALKGRDRDGNPLGSSAVDFDRDGAISLLEAHTRARIASVSLDVPTTTSERYLRQLDVAPDSPAELPEEAAVIAALGPRLEAYSAEQARTAWEKLDDAVARLDAELTAAEKAADQRYLRLSARLLARWPVLDDPYHPRFAATLSEYAPAIAAELDQSEAGRDYRAAQAAVGAIEARFWDRQVEEALALRLLRAYDTAALAGGLQREGGARWAAYQGLLRCERSVP